MTSSEFKGIKTYKKYWEDQASFMDQLPWNQKKILKLTLSNDFEENIEELKFSNHSLARENGQLTLRLKVPYNYSQIDDFELKALGLLGIDRSCLIDMSLTNSNCTKDLTKTK
ncbi:MULTISPECIES: hypothetical protein [Prochlorococcus]|uniref:Uncharacterized protein n=1 Tax=Prochlorococcus marinus (strain SARG / CCMP1375 / SS120) TaxID=167539 RepID=Q7VAF8_PROMA|nr:MULTISPECIES: hypothetical protein [Prochlorococcus]AAQ00549.1 Predicted protein [Prochlorococcus marinus subsp. marinus str. CCMP1375]KGG10279.1 hypothetical protein EV04_1945 [Prochlorococcus marinus str. LG]KGG22635.1 hypothetical protein EV08_0050 [Prochlorococcus marinus str. SS2]KGG24213.1 hypothetical protein EV09_0820 [Prochlorococcus marinus str. SS35]KGG33174.1 hypothetical protein EV10_0807 [Prochlorococcus marinus str. SS51]